MLVGGPRYLLPVSCRLAQCLSHPDHPVVQNVDSLAHASQLLSEAQVCTVETQNSVLVPEGAVPMVFRWSSAIELQTTLSEGDRELRSKASRY